MSICEIDSCRVYFVLHDLLTNFLLNLTTARVPESIQKVEKTVARSDEKPVEN